MHEWKIKRQGLGGHIVIRCKKSQEELTVEEAEARLNATEMLSAKVARRNAVILRLNAEKLSYGKQTQGYADSADLFAYAETLK